jgi:signal transduction histidine kinase
MRRIGVWPAVIGLGTVMVLGLFLVIVLRNVEEMRALRNETFGIEHTLEVQRELDAILIAESEADADARAFLMTTAPQFLEAMRINQQQAWIRLDRLSELIDDNHAQRDRILQLRAAIKTRRSRLEQVIASRQGGTLDDAINEARAAESIAPRDTVRSLIADMESEESALLASRREQADRSYQRAVRGRIGSGVVSASLLISIVVTAGLHARNKTRREEALVRSEHRARDAVMREQEARAEAERVNREKDQFLAVLSHELRTPLNAVLGWTQILQASSPDEQTSSRGLAAIRRNAEAQQRLVEDLLDVSRIISGKLPFQRESFDLRSAVAAAVDSVRLSAEGRGLTLEAVLGNTPPATGDGGRIQQVAANLLSNALKFTPSGGRVTVSLKDEGSTALLEVSDTGIGLTPELQPHIFERFRQGDSSSTRAHGGLGLGLAIAKHIVEAHAGTIRVHSDGPNSGTSFRVRLPYG